MKLVYSLETKVNEVSKCYYSHGDILNFPWSGLMMSWT